MARIPRYQQKIIINEREISQDTSLDCPRCEKAVVASGAKVPDFKTILRALNNGKRFEARITHLLPEHVLACALCQPCADTVKGVSFFPLLQSLERCQPRQEEVTPEAIAFEQRRAARQQKEDSEGGPYHQVQPPPVRVHNTGGAKRMRAELKLVETRRQASKGPEFTEKMKHGRKCKERIRTQREIFDRNGGRDWSPADSDRIREDQEVYGRQRLDHQGARGRR